MDIFGTSLNHVFYHYGDCKAWPSLNGQFQSVGGRLFESQKVLISKWKVIVL